MPIWAIIAKTQVILKSVDLPPIFGPVRRSIDLWLESSTSLGTNKI